MNTLSKEAETRILDAISDVCAHVTDGMDPTDAVIKVAESDHLSPNFIKLVCTGYNTGATTYQREKTSHILDKMAEFPLANLDTVMETLHPNKPVANNILKEASVVSDEYSKRPKQYSGPTGSQSSVSKALRTKSANAGGVHAEDAKTDRRQLPSEERMKHAYCQALDQRRVMEVKRAEYSHSQDKLLHGLADLLETVKRGSYDLPSLEYAAKARYGETGTWVFNYLYANEPRLKRAHDERKLVTADWTNPVLRRVEGICKAASDVVRLRIEYDGVHAATSDKISELVLPFDSAPLNSTTEKTSILSGSNSLPQTKMGFLGGAIGSAAFGAGGAAARSLMGSNSLAKTPDQMAGGMSEDLDDPEHDGEIRKIQARSMLQDLMMNDEVIAGYDPGEVLDAYNEIVGVTPRSATQAAIVRPLLRKRLTQGAIEPFEAAEMVNIEKGLGQASNTGAPMAAVNKEGSANVLQHRILG